MQLAEASPKAAGSEADALSHVARVLVVDDEQINREILTRMLQRNGYAAVPVATGREALHKVRTEKFDVVLLDVVMPEMDGFECLRLMREIQPVGQLPIIMVTAEVDRDRIVAAFRAGASDYVTKPIDREITLARLATHAQLRKTLQALSESEERYALAARGSNDGLWDWNVRTNEVYYSPRWKAMLGFGEDEVGKSPQEWLCRIHPEDIDTFQSHVADAAVHQTEKQTHLECELRMLHKDGGYRWMLCRGVYVREVDGHISRMAGSLTDITEGKVGDPLTGLPNRLLFVDRLERAIERTRRSQQGYFAVMFLDLDNFKLINDSLGHQAGDKLLITIASRLENCLRSVDSVCRLPRSSTVARHAGDEFTVLLEDIQSPDHVEQVADRVLSAVSEPAKVEQMEIFPTLSIGWAIGDSKTQCAEDVLREADTAMYHAKSEGRNRHRQFDPGMQHWATERLELEKDLRRALQDNEFFLLYQPIIDIQRGQGIGFETLIRWRHPRRGILQPLAFIEAAEEMGLIVPLGWWIMEQACAQAARWQTQYPHAPLHVVSVNCAVKQLYQPDFLDHFRQILQASGANPRGICVEVTESTLMDKPDHVRPIMSGLRELGVRIGIDDFGTGYSSLAYLHRFPLDMLKIDRSFVSTMLECGESLEIVRTIIDLGRSLKLNLVAEGVETDAQRLRLLELGCNFAQGYLWSPPVTEQLAAQFLTQATRGGVAIPIDSTFAPPAEVC